jgi:ELP3 family radical SAM enzyme/protein acetyltransferase
MDLEDLVKASDYALSDKDIDKITVIVKELFDPNNKLIYPFTNREQLKAHIITLGRKHKVIPSLVKILAVYRSLCSNKELAFDPFVERLLRTKTVRSLSGVVVITVFTSPYPETSKGKQEFSCEYNCHYCPKEPNQPRSYLYNEPAVRRANQNNFISTDQFWDRAKSYIIMGHPLDKIELIVSGGTFSSYPREYITNFFRDQFYAANVAFDKVCGKHLRSPLSLQEEQDINQNDSLVKIIGITIETRPDRVKSRELRYFRELGVTRVQIGVQHTNDEILTHINRGCTDEHTRKAIKLLKEAGFKVDIHLMPDLPHPSHISEDQMIELDKQMFNTVINDQAYQADQWKIYPCQTVPWTEIEKWYNEGLYKPYAEVVTTFNGMPSNKLFDLLVEIKQQVKPWVRLNRVIRDIPESYILGGNTNSCMRSDLLELFQKQGFICNCIRCREVKGKDIVLNEYILDVTTYPSSDGIEYFINWKHQTQNTLLGFLRLRINSDETLELNKTFPELNKCGMIRELHIYGQVIDHTSDNTGNGVQHIGLGKQLISKAEEIVLSHNLTKISVISGVGVRNYYIKQGFEPTDGDGKFLIKTIDSNKQTHLPNQILSDNKSDIVNKDFLPCRLINLLTNLLTNVSVGQKIFITIITSIAILIGICYKYNLF